MIASDIEEVRKALRELNLEPADQPVGLLDLLGDLFDDIFGPILLARVITIAFLDEFFPIDAPPAGETQGEDINGIVRTLERMPPELTAIQARLRSLRADHRLHATSELDRTLNAHLIPLEANLDQIGSILGLALSLLEQLPETIGGTNAAQELREALEELEAQRTEKALDFRDRLEEDVPEVPATTTI